MNKNFDLITMSEVSQQRYKLFFILLTVHHLLCIFDITRDSVEFSCHYDVSGRHICLPLIILPS